jgi:hypothetical protein
MQAVGRLALSGVFLALWAAQALAQVVPTVNLPQTGQQTCYTSAGASTPCPTTGQDAETRRGLSWPHDRFTDNGDMTVLDRLTGLTWAKAAGTPATIPCAGGIGCHVTALVCTGDVNRALPLTQNLDMRWQQALDYVRCLNDSDGGLGAYGKNDWRLPTINELESLVNAQAPSPAAWLSTAPQVFVNVINNHYWSSTSWGDVAKRLDMSSGAIALVYKDWAAGAQTTWYSFVWPVRGRTSGPAAVYQTGQTTQSDANTPPMDDGGAQAPGVAWPVGRFSVSGDSVADRLTGLMWTKAGGTPGTRDAGTGRVTGMICVASYVSFSYQTKNWQEALNYIACLNNNNYLGVSDWRLPNRKEMLSLVRHEQFDQYKPLFTNEQWDTYWTSTTVGRTPANAWDMDLTDGPASEYKATTYRYVWPVRLGGAAFGNPRLTVSPAVRILTVTNAAGASGSNDLYIESLTLAGADAGQFSIVPATDTCTKARLAPRATCAFQVAFSPTTLGQKDATVGLLSNDPSQPSAVTYVALRGGGSQTTPAIAWPTPAAIAYGAALSATQLNATASSGPVSVDGGFVYTPAGGTVLPIGTHTLSATFTPTDTVNYTAATATTTLVVVALAFTDDPLQPGVTPVKAIHLAELRQAVDSLRSRFTLGAFAWTDATVVAGTTPVRAVHVAELRTALGEVYAAAVLPAPTYARANLVAGATVVTAVEIAELRAAILAIW